MTFMAYRNKEDQARAARRHYVQNRQKIIDRARTFTIKIRKRNKEFVEKYKLSHPCVDCGITDIRVLEFDHVSNNKLIEIGNAINKCWTIAKIEQEIKKCEVRCANCHRIVTYERRGLM